MEGKQENIEKTTNSNGSLGNAQIDTREISPQGRYIRLEDKLGSGAYKDVWRAYDTNDGIEVAWNVVKLNRIPPAERKRIKTEVKLLKDIQHKNVIRYYNSWIDREKEQIIFVTEMMSSGSLKHYLRKNTIIRWNAVKRWCKQILTGLEFLHANHIIHRDIKCDNLFINGTTGDLRIGDLGLSTRITEERSALKANNSAEIRQITAVTLTCLGTPEFMAPEMYEETYDEKVDIYAFGMCVIEMVTGLIPYHLCTSAAQVYKKVINGELPPELEIVLATNPRATEFIRLCLQKRTDRPSAKELLVHEFLQPNTEEDYKEVRNRHHRLFAEMMGVIDEGDEGGIDDEELDNELQLMMHNTTIATPSTHPMDAIIASAASLSLPPPPPASDDRLEAPLTARTSSGGGSNGSGVPRLRKTLVTGSSDDLPSLSNHSYDDAKALTHCAVTVKTDNLESNQSIKLVEKSLSPSSKSFDQIIIKDIIDHPEKPNTLIIFLQLPVNTTEPSNNPVNSANDSSNNTIDGDNNKEIPGPIPIPRTDSTRSFENSTKSNSHNTSKLVIEFEYDLIQDTLTEIMEEMMQLEEFHDSPSVHSATSERITSLTRMIEPIILFAQSRSEGREGSRKVSAARLAVEGILTSPDYQCCTCYQPLNQKYGALLQTVSQSEQENEGQLNPSQVNINDIDKNIEILSKVHADNNNSSNSILDEKNVLLVEDSNNTLGGIIDLTLFQDLLHLTEFQEMLEKYRDQYQKVVKDYDQKLSSIQIQKEKTKETFNKEFDQFNARRNDLDRQLDSMQSKYKERMAEFSARKNQAVEEHIEKSNNVGAVKGKSGTMEVTAINNESSSNNSNTSEKKLQSRNNSSSSIIIENVTILPE